MNQNDEELIQALSNKLKSAHPVNKDAQAQELIASEIGSQPDALYLLTQAVLLQEQAIRSLKEQVSSLQNQPNKSSFLGSLFGNTNNQQQPPYRTNTSFGQGSFLGSALTTAAGVAGGMMLFEGISHLFNSGSAGSTQSSMLSGASNAIADPLIGQDQMLNDGFGSGDDIGSFDPSGGGDWSSGFEDF